MVVVLGPVDTVVMSNCSTAAKTLKSSQSKIHRNEVDTFSTDVSIVNLTNYLHEITTQQNYKKVEHYLFQNCSQTIIFFHYITSHKCVTH